jgi:3-phosphoshikimate 1-carboxyvinyltransferase
MSQSLDQATVRPCPRLSGVVRVPGDKSISHRAVLLSGLADGESIIRGFLPSEDCLNSLGAMQALGAATVRESEDCVRIRGTAGRLNAPGAVLNMGNSGTSVRLFAGVLSGGLFTSEMTGDASLRSRPMRRIQAPLQQMGATVELLGPNGCAPVRITGGRLTGIEYRLPVASAQVKSCILLAGLFAQGDTTVVEPERTRDHTERMLRAAGVNVRSEGARISVSGNPAGPRISAAEWLVPGDFSSAAFWIAAAAAVPGCAVTVDGVGLNPTRTALLDVLRRMGADVDVQVGGALGSVAEGEAMGSVHVRGRLLKGTIIGGAEIPNLIDELPILSAAAALGDGETVIRDAAELRVKESDRIATMAAGLRACGVDVVEKPDGMVIRGGARIRGEAVVDSRGDHRIAMSMAILALFADMPVTVKNVACIATSYPTFWRDLRNLTGTNPVSV